MIFPEFLRIGYADNAGLIVSSCAGDGHADAFEGITGLVGDGAEQPQDNGR